MTKSQSRLEGFNNNNKAEKDISALDEVVNKVRDAGEVVREFANDAQGSISKAQNRAQEQIRLHPFGAAAVILATGMVLGSLFTRR